jgi:hypothetical protein
MRAAFFLGCPQDLQTIDLKWISRISTNRAGCLAAFATAQPFRGNVNGSQVLTATGEMRQKRVTVGKKA